MLSDEEIEAAIKAIEAVPIMDGTYSLSGEDAKAVARAALEAQAVELAAVKEMYAHEGVKALYELERAEAAEARVKELEKLCNDTEAQLQDYAQRLAEAERVIERAIQEAVADDYDDWFCTARAYLDKKEKSHD